VGRSWSDDPSPTDDVTIDTYWCSPASNRSSWNSCWHDPLDRPCTVDSQHSYRPLSAHEWTRHGQGGRVTPTCARGRCIVREDGTSASTARSSSAAMGTARHALGAIAIETTSIPPRCPPKRAFFARVGQHPQRYTLVSARRETHAIMFRSFFPRANATGTPSHKSGERLKNVSF
jgi:hypothetical protein